MLTRRRCGSATRRCDTDCIVPTLTGSTLTARTAPPGAARRPFHGHARHDAARRRVPAADGRVLPARVLAVRLTHAAAARAGAARRQGHTQRDDPAYARVRLRPALPTRCVGPRLGQVRAQGAGLHHRRDPQGGGPRQVQGRGSRAQDLGFGGGDARGLLPHDARQPAGLQP